MLDSPILLDLIIFNTILRVSQWQMLHTQQGTFWFKCKHIDKLFRWHEFMACSKLEPEREHRCEVNSITTLALSSWSDTQYNCLLALISLFMPSGNWWHNQSFQQHQCHLASYPKIWHSQLTITHLSSHFEGFKPKMWALTDNMKVLTTELQLQYQQHVKLIERIGQSGLWLL